MAKKLIYADHAATTPLSVSAQVAMQPYLTENFYNPSTKYSAARNARKAIENARQQIAQCIGAIADEIYFTSGGTEADNWSIKGTAFRYPNQRKRIITSQIEHHAVLNSCSFLERLGYEVIYLPVDTNGIIDKYAFEQALSRDTVLISIMLANNELGTIEPISELAKIAHQHDVLFHSDAVQAIGHIPVHVNELGIDMLSASAHKFGGPKGIGFLYVRKGVPLESLISGGSQEYGRRAGTENVASIVGMAAALQESCATMEDASKHLFTLKNVIQETLTQTPLDWQINGGDHVLPGTISLSIKGIEGERLLHRLDLMGVQVATGSACDSKETQLSHVLQAIRLQPEYAYGTIRLSLSTANTEEDVRYIVHLISKIMNKR